METIEEIVQQMPETIDPTTLALTDLYTRCERCGEIRCWKDSEGRLWAWPTCSCYRSERARELIAASGLAEYFSTHTFDRFITNTPWRTTLKGLAEKYVATILQGSRPVPWFYIGGNPGSGKSHICTAICKELLTKNQAVKYMKWDIESRNLKSYTSADSYEEQIARYANAQVLYIDDLLKMKYSDAPAFTDADIKICFSILNARYLQNRPTIISSEWSIKQLIPADEGTFSRIVERCNGFLFDIERKPENNFRLMESEAGA